MLLYLFESFNSKHYDSQYLCSASSFKHVSDVILLEDHSAVMSYCYKPEADHPMVVSGLPSQSYAFYLLLKFAPGIPVLLSPDS